MRTFVLIALRNLIKNRTRSLVLGGAIAGVTTLMVVLLSTIAGIQSTILHSATALLTGHVNIAGFYKISQTSAAPTVTDYRKLHDLAVREVPEAELILERIKAYGKIISETSSIQVPMWGVNMKQEEQLLGKLPLAQKKDYIEDYKPAPGEPETEGSVARLSQSGTIAIFASHAKKLKVRVGDIVTVSMPTSRNVSNTKDVQVAAVLQDMGMLSSFSVFLPDVDTREIYRVTDTSTGQIMIILKSAADTKKVEDRLRRILAQQNYRLMDKEGVAFWLKFDRVAGESWTGQKIDITTWEDETSFLKWIIDIFSALTFVMTSVLMVIIVLGLMNTLWMSIRERTHEVGTLRAIGLQRHQVTFMFFVESLTLSFAATLTGLALGTVLCLLLNLLKIPVADSFQLFLMANELHLVVTPRNLLLTLFMITFFLTLGGLYPSYKAGKLKPITAMNQIT